MLSKVTLVIILAIAGVNCEDTKSEIFQKNGVTFEVEGDKFVVDGAFIAVLRRGSITDIEEMSLLWLIHSNISTIEPGAFGNLPNLKNLYIMHNNLQKIEVGVFNNLNITWLTLSDNGLEYIASHAFDNMTHLAVVDISSNKLKKWNNQWFANTPSVKFFFFDDNLFTEIPAEAFGEKKRSGDFYYISFDGNPINQIDDDAFKNFETLSHLDININSTDALDGNFLQATHFDEVDIRINKVECLDEKYLVKIIVANKTRLAGYKFDGDCKKKIAAWATTHQKTISVLYDLPGK